MFTRVLVANRGEIAVRVIRALHELGVEAVAVYSTADEDALHVRLADRAVRIGPPPAAESYLSIPAIVAAAATTGCEAVHPGYGFLSENADFVRACEDNDLVFIGPPAEVMERMGDKARAKAEMRAAGVPLVPGTEGIASAGRGARGSRGARLPGPAQGRGGRRRARHAAGGGSGRPPGLYDRASAEAQAAFGDGTLYVEKVITPARHVEIQVLCDNHGNVLTCGERECSIQRRHQKLIEESPSPALDDELREEMEAAAERACEHIGYRNAGTIEFLVGPDGSFSFIEMNTRLQVEHPGHGAHHVDRPRPRAGADRGRRARSLTAAAPGPRERARDRAADQRRGSGARLRAGAGADRALPAAARAGRARRHVRRGWHGHLAALRLAHREGHRPRREPQARDRARATGAQGVRDRGRPDDA